MYHGRFSKTISVSLYKLQVLVLLVLLGEGNVFDVSPAHSEMLILTKKYLLGRKVTKYKKVGRDVSVWMHRYKPIVFQASEHIFF